VTLAMMGCIHDVDDACGTVRTGAER